MGFFKKAEPTQPVLSEVHHSQNEGSINEKSDAAYIESTAGDDHTYIDPEIERRVVRKLDKHVVPLVAGLYLLAFLDRSNVGNARIAGMSTDLNLGTGDRYDWLLTIFYISYIVFEWQALMWKLIPPHIWAAFVVLGWGIVSAVQAGINTWGAEMALRFVMGWMEAGYGPGIPYLLSFFYLRHELGARIGVFLSCAPLANTFAGALAYGITSGSPAIAKWRLLFLVEGLPTIAMAPIAFFFLPDSPEKARFLTEDEKRVAKARGVRQVGGGVKRLGSIQWREIGATFLDLKAWLTALMYFSCNVSFASLPVFLPTILNQMGFSAINAQGLTAPPFFLSFLVTLLSTWIADKTQQRGLMIMGLSAMGGVGYIMLAVATSVGARYTGVFLAAAGIFPSIANILPWVLNNQGSDTRRGAGIIILNVVGQCGPLLGTRLYPTTEGPYYVKGQSVCAAFMFFTTILAGSLRLLLMYENKQLDKKYGTLADQQARINEAQASGAPAEKTAQAGVENYGPAYRYIL